MLGNQGPPATGSHAPPLGPAAVVAAIIWAVGLLVGDVFHVLMTGDVDTTGFLILILALAPAWAFIGRNVSISFLGQSVGINLTQDDVNKAAGVAPSGGGQAPAGGRQAPAGGGQAPDVPPASGSADDGTANGFVRSVDEITGMALRVDAHPDLLESLQGLQTRSTRLRDAGVAPRPRVVVVDPPSAGDPAIDLRNRIAVRLNALAQRYEIVPPGNSAASLLAALQARNVLTSDEAGALGKLIDLGNEVAQGRAPGPRIVSLIQNAQVPVIANLDRKLADG
jgi:hypothetical protein